MIHWFYRYKLDLALWLLKKARIFLSRSIEQNEISRHEYQSLIHKNARNREIRLKTLMLQLGVMSNDVAHATNLSKSMVSMYLKGKRGSPKLDKYFDKLKEKK